MKNFDLLSIRNKNLRIRDFFENGLKIADTVFYFKQNDNHFELYKGSEHVTSFSKRYERLDILPVLLDRPLYIRLKKPVTVFPDQTINFYLERPLNGEMMVKDKETSEFLYKFSLFNFKLINYGIVNDGFVCYYVESDIVKKPANGNYALVPISLVNKHNEPHLFTKLIIYKNFLKLLVTPEMFITNNVTVTVSNSMTAYISYSDNTDENLKILETYDFENKEKQPALYKMLKNFQKKGTGIEYGF